MYMSMHVEYIYVCNECVCARIPLPRCGESPLAISSLLHCGMQSPKSVVMVGKILVFIWRYGGAVGVSYQEMWQDF